MTTLLDIVGGFVLLFVGAEVLVRGASRLAAMMKIPALVIGLTIVAFGTSAPELAVSVLSARRGVTGIAVGNVLGSNILNVLAILGLVSMIRPLAIHNRVVWRDVPLMLTVSGIAFALAWDGSVSRLEGGLLALGLPVFLYLMRGASEGEEPRDAAPVRRTVGAFLLQAALVLLGFILLVGGSRWLVRGATVLAARLGFSDVLIGLTLVAAGTSLPELATSLVAALRKEEDIAVGNIVGSNVFNLLAVLGISSAVSTSGLSVTDASRFVDFPVMLASSFLCLVFFASGGKLTRSEGAFFLASFLVYMSWLFLDAAGTPLPASLPFFVGMALAIALGWVLWLNRTTGRG